MKNIVVAALLVAGALALNSCRKDPLKNLSGSDALLYVTNHSDSANFSSYHTFSIADSVAVINNDRYQGKTVGDADIAYVNAVKAQLLARGYTQVGNEQTPDLGITVSRVYNTSTGVFDYGYWDPYYGGYWDPYYWGYGGYGYYFPSYYGVYSITEGAISIDAFDLKNANESKKINNIWNGLVRGSGVFNASNAAPAVEALFNQSTYFKAN